MESEDHLLDNSTFDEGFCSFNCSFNLSRENFVDISNTSGSKLQHNLKAVVCASHILTESDERSKIPIPKPILCGLSSFQGFNMTTKSLKISRSPEKCIKYSVQKENVTDYSKEQPVSNKSTQLVCPNILKHRRGQCLKANDQLVSPIKSLTFSPSRFLNTSEDHDFSEDGPNYNGVVKELSFSNSSFDTDDSGIGCSYIDSSGPLSPPLLASTPLSARTTDERWSKDYPWSSPSDKSHASFNFPLQSTPKRSKQTATSVNVTPLTCKDLNELTPRTPTPFKCPSFGMEAEISLKDEGADKRCDDAPFAPAQDACFKRPSPVGPNWSRRHWRKGKDRTQKTARKALLLEHDTTINQQLKKKINAISSKSKEPTCLYSMASKDQSCLLENKAVIEQKKIGNGKKYIYYTRQHKGTMKKTDLDKHWVAVVCGRSFDQKVMTEAARRCLRRNTHSNIFKKL